MRYPFLALLSAGPAHGYELKTTLESRFGGLLPALNAGQVYTTLARLERDGLVAAADEREDARGKRTYALTDAGRREAERWISRPSAGAKLRDDFFMKLVLALATRLTDPLAVIEAQRAAALQALRDLDAMAAAGDDGPAAALLLEGTALHLQADLRWLDACEQRLRRDDEEDHR
jgi:DNA-binding PadR family transcriptional regulator